MVARGDFRHDAAIDRMQVHLAVQSLREEPVLGVVERDAGLIAAGFQSKDNHS